MSNSLAATVLNINAAIEAIATEHATLGLDPSLVTAEAAARAVSRTGAQTTTELLLLLAKFHAVEADDLEGAELLAEFARKLAAHEAGLV